jgi:hypothetical protein
MQELINELWKKMGCKKMLDFTSLPTVIFPVGSMFWYRPLALKRFFEMHLSTADVPPEPLPIDETILHCLERMFVYIAWNENYDYRIMIPENQMSYFADNIIHNKEKIAIWKRNTNQYQLFVFVMSASRLVYSDNINYSYDKIFQSNDLLKIKGWLFYRGYERNNECKRFVVLMRKDNAYIFDITNELRYDVNNVFSQEHNVCFSGIDTRLYTGNIPPGEYSIAFGIKKHWAARMEIAGIGGSVNIEKEFL